MITRYDPFREALSLRRAMDQLFEQSFVNPSMMLDSSKSLVAPMDVCETENGYEVDVALPGVRPEDIDLTVDQNILTIRGRYSQQNEHQDQSQSQTQDQQQAQADQTQQQGQPQAGQQNDGQQTQQGRTQRHRRGHTWLSREIVSGSFERTITFPKPIDVDHIQTNFQNGMLTILLPVSETSRPKRISITAGQQSQSQPIAVEAGEQQR